MAAPNVGLLIPGPSVGDMPRPDEYTAFFRAADEMGFHSLWATERVLHRIRVVQPFTMLAAAAAVTSRILLGTAVVLGPIATTPSAWPTMWRTWTTCRVDA